MLRDPFGPVDPVERLRERAGFDSPSVPTREVRMCCRTVALMRSRGWTGDPQFAVMGYLRALGVVLGMLPAARYMMDQIRENGLPCWAVDDPGTLDLIETCGMVLEAESLLAGRP